MSTELLTNIELFGDLTAEHRQELAAAMQQQPFAATQPIFWIGDSGTSFFIIKSGHVTLSCPDESGVEITLAQLGPGQFFGELSLLDGARRTATARAATDTLLLSLDREAFHAFLLKHPAATLQIIAELGRRQRDMVDKLRGVTNANEAINETLTPWARISETIARVSASKGFVLSHLVFVTLWVSCNLIRGRNGWDPFPFQLLTMLGTLEAIFLSIFVLISQNRQSEKDRVRADLDYQVSLKAHVEMMQLHRKLDELRAIVEKQSTKN